MMAFEPTFVGSMGETKIGIGQKNQKRVFASAWVAPHLTVAPIATLKREYGTNGKIPQQTDKRV